MDNNNYIDKWFDKFFKFAGCMALIMLLLVVAIVSTGIYLAVENWG